MYFKNKDESSEEKNILSFFKKYKIYIYLFIGLFLLLIILFLGINNKNNDIIVDNDVTLSLMGDREVIIYMGSDYVEPGFYAIDSEGNDVTDQVVITSNIDVNTVGKYKIVYKIGDIVVERHINVIDGYVNINLNGSIDMYLLVGETYVEPGYTVDSNLDISNEDIIVTGNVDTSTKGEYKLIYSVNGINGEEVNAVRNIVVMDLNVTFEYDKKYTNKGIVISYSMNNEYLDYILLPDNNKVYNSAGNYSINDSGEYKFIVYGRGGRYKENVIKINNIDKVAPTGSCSIKRDGNNTILSIDAKDNAGIDRYVYNGKTYKENNFNVTGNINNTKISVYDVSGNSNEINCNIIPSVYINSIRKNGVIVTIQAYEFVNKVAGYYFSYNKTRPNKNSGGYIATNSSNIDVVRLPGTTYIWVEDNKGNISNYKTISISNNDILMTNGNEYNYLQNERLDNFLDNNGYSISKLNNLIARSVRAAGLYTKEAAATAALTFPYVLADKYQIRIPYFIGGKSYDFGAKGSFGSYRYGVDENRDNKEYFYDGFDCTGFVTWAYINAGYDIGSSYYKYGRYFDAWWKERVNFDNGQVGDILVNNDSRAARHVKIIIGKTSDAYIIAESTGSYGMVIRTHSFSKPSNYKIVKAKVLMNEYSKTNKSQIPNGY